MMRKNLIRVITLVIIVLGQTILSPSFTLAEPIIDFLDSVKASEKYGFSNHEDKTVWEISRKLLDAKLNNFDIKIQFHNGVATLSGQMTDFTQVTEVKRIVLEIKEVKHVKVHLQQQAYLLNLVHPIDMFHSKIQKSAQPMTYNYVVPGKTLVPTYNGLKPGSGSVLISLRPYQLCLSPQYRRYSQLPTSWRPPPQSWYDCAKNELTSIQLPAELLKGVGKQTSVGYPYSLGYPYFWDFKYPGTSLVEVLYNIDIRKSPQPPGMPGIGYWLSYAAYYPGMSSPINNFGRNLPK